MLYRLAANEPQERAPTLRGVHIDIDTVLLKLSQLSFLFGIIHQVNR